MELQKTLHLPPMESSTEFLAALAQALERINAILYAKFKYPFAFVIRGTVEVAAAALAIPTTHSVVSKTTGAGAEVLTLADGYSGQILTIVLVADGGGDGTLTPDTSTDFATIVLADAEDRATLLFVDDTIGWIILNLRGAAGPPVVT